MRKLIACLACRNAGTRLYGKPLQNLDIESKITILDYIIDLLRTTKEIDEIVLGISEGVENLPFVDIAKSNNIPYIIGDETDVLKRLIDCCDHVNGTDIFRMTTESPFNCFELVGDAWAEHQNNDYDLTVLDNVPDGCGMEIIKLAAYKKSWRLGEAKHRSEFTSLFIRENKNQFKIGEVVAPEIIKRTDIRLTVDYPEDLVVCRAVYDHFKDLAPRIPVKKIIKFLDENPGHKKLVDKFVDEGLKTMYL